MKLCKNCRVYNTDSAQSCANCGERLDAVPPPSQARRQSGSGISGAIRRHKVLSIVGIVVLLFLAVAGVSLMATPLHITQNGGTVTLTPDRQTQLQNKIQNAGFSLVTPLTKTTVNGRDVYTGTALKTGVRYNVQYTFTNTTYEATNLREQKIAEYKAEGYTSASSDASSSSYALWSGVSGNQVVYVGSNAGGNGTAPFAVVVKAVEA